MPRGGRCVTLEHTYRPAVVIPSRTGVQRRPPTCGIIVKTQFNGCGRETRFSGVTIYFC